MVGMLAKLLLAVLLLVIGNYVPTPHGVPYWILGGGIAAWASYDGVRRISKRGAN